MEPEKKRIIHTVRISGMFNTPPSEKDIYHALKEFQRLQRILRFVPLAFLFVVGVVFYVVMKLTELRFPAFILVIVSTIMILKELSTMMFSIHMRNRLMKPLERLRVAFGEIAAGNYGYTLEEEQFNMVGDLIESFNKMSKELKEANDLKKKYELNRKELIAGISHDLKTPITSIIGYVDAITTGVANTPEKEKLYLSVIESNAKYTNTLIDDLFLFSKLDINQMKYEFEEIPIDEYLRDVMIEKQLELEEKGIRLDYELDIPEGRLLPIDGKMVYRIISNIISNSVKYSDKEEARIQVKAQNEPDGIRVEITDNGKGITKDNLKQIFDVFYRADPSRNKDVGGSGLGLAITKQLVVAHGGEIYAESELGKETKITFTLKDKSGEE